MLSTAVALGPGPGLFGLNLLVALGGLAAATLVLRRLFWRRRPDAAPIVLATLGLLIAAFAGPLSPWSGVLRDLSGGRSPEAYGAQALYAALALGATRGREGGLWFLPRVAATIAVVAALVVDPEWAFIPLVGALAGEGLLAPSMGLVLPVLPTALERLIRGGLDWRHERLAAEYPVVPTVNMWEAFVFALSPTTLIVGFALAFAAMTAPRYVGYRVRRAFERRGEPGGAAILASGGLAAVALFTPELWPGVLVCLAGAAVALLGGSRVETLEPVLAASPGGL